MPNFDRQIDIFDPATYGGRVFLVGAGGIGGMTAIALKKLGLQSLRVFDFDVVERHNQPNQIYGERDIMKYKVNALNEIVMRLTDSHIVPFAFKPKGFIAGDVVILGVDSMEARRQLYQMAIESKVPFLIDGRIGGQVVRVYTVQMENASSRRRYEATLQGDGVPVPCTQAAIIDVMLCVSSLITRAFRLHATGQKVEESVLWDQRNLYLEKK